MVNAFPEIRHIQGYGKDPPPPASKIEESAGERYDLFSATRGELPRVNDPPERFSVWLRKYEE